MAIHQLPSDLIISDVDITQSTPQFVTSALNKKRRSKDRGIHQLKGSFNITVTGDREQRRFDSWLLKMRGRLNQFPLVLGNRFSVDPSRLQNVTLGSSASIGATSLNIAGFFGNIWEGDYFTLPNDTKVYMAQNDLTSSGGTLQIYPPLRQAQLINTGLVFENIEVLAMLDADEQPVSYTEGGIITEYACKWEEYV